MNNTKTMHYRTAKADFKTREEDGKRYLEGYFSVFNTRYELFEGAAETVLPGAFLESLQKDDIRALVNHNTDLVLGRLKSGTLKLHEDEKGLYGRIEINSADTDAMNLYARVQRGDVSQCSFGFDVIDETYDQDGQGNSLWALRKVKLYEVSVVTFPAYVDTSIEARKKDLEHIRERENDLWRSEILKKLRKGEEKNA